MSLFSVFLSSLPTGQVFDPSGQGENGHYIKCEKGSVSLENPSKTETKGQRFQFVRLLFPVDVVIV